MDQNLIIWAVFLEHACTLVFLAMFLGHAQGVHPLAPGSPSSKAPLWCLPPSVPQAAPGRVSGLLPAAVPGGAAGTMHWQARACPAVGVVLVAARPSHNATAPA